LSRGSGTQGHTGVSDEDPAKSGGKQAAADRDKSGRFKPGASGNPRGKPLGTRHRTTLMLEAQLDAAGPKLIRQAIKLAMAGDGAVLRALLPLLLPPRKERPAEFPLPAIESAEDALAASRLLVAGVANGAISAEEAAKLGGLLELHAKLLEVHELESRILALEQERGLGGGVAIQ
jgi:hypothetical protein